MGGVLGRVGLSGFVRKMGILIGICAENGDSYRDLFRIFGGFGAVYEGSCILVKLSGYFRFCLGQKYSAYYIWVFLGHFWGFWEK